MSEWGCSLFWGKLYGPNKTHLLVPPDSRLHLSNKGQEEPEDLSQEKRGPGWPGVEGKGENLPAEAEALGETSSFALGRASS
jgi:hypothetical protein